MNFVYDFKSVILSIFDKKIGYVNLCSRDTVKIGIVFELKSWGKSKNL